MRKKKSKPTTFRHSQAALAVIEDYMKQHNLKSKSQAVNKIIEKFTPAMTKQAPQTADVFEGLIIQCPMRPFVVDILGAAITLPVTVHQSVCINCPKYPCINWKWAESWKRIHDWKQWQGRKQDFEQKQLAKMEIQQ